MTKKHPVKPRCTCKGRTDRHEVGPDRQRHAPGCPIIRRRG